MNFVKGHIYTLIQDWHVDPDQRMCQHWKDYNPALDKELTVHEHLDAVLPPPPKPYEPLGELTVEDSDNSMDLPKGKILSVDGCPVAMFWDETYNTTHFNADLTPRRLVHQFEIGMRAIEFMRMIENIRQHNCGSCKIGAGDLGRELAAILDALDAGPETGE